MCLRSLALFEARKFYILTGLARRICMLLIFDHRMFAHVNGTLQRERGRGSRVVSLAAALLRVKAIAVMVRIFEAVATFALCLPIPVYSSLIYLWITNARGLPSYGGMYLRGLYYRGKLGLMESNVFIDQGVFSPIRTVSGCMNSRTSTKT